MSVQRGPKYRGRPREALTYRKQNILQQEADEGFGVLVGKNA